MGVVKVTCACVCLSVCLCVTRRYCIKTTKRRITQTPHNSPGTLVFWRQKSLMDDPLPPEICAQSDPPSFEHQNVDQYPLIAPQQWEPAKKVQLVLIGRRPRAFQRAIDEPCKISDNISKAIRDKTRQDKTTWKSRTQAQQCLYVRISIIHFKNTI